MASLNQPQLQNSPPPVPQVIKGTALFFDIIVWASIGIYTLLAVLLTSDGDYFFLVPMALYTLLYFGFTHFDYQPGRGFIRQNLLWNMRSPAQAWQPWFFILGSFGLVIWLNQYGLLFMGFYFILFGHTIGVMGWGWSLPLCFIEIAGLLYQAGLFNPARPTEVGTLVTIVILCAVGIMYIITLVILLNSRIKSEGIVQELKATKLQLEEALSREKEVAVLRERDRMAREMHDVLGHALVLVAVKIEAAQRLQAVNPPKATAELEATKELVRQSMNDLRASLAELRSPALEAAAKPLSQALQEWATVTAQESQLGLVGNFEPGMDNLPLPIQDALWRVGREAIFNVVKHACARNIELNLFAKDNRVFLSVADDGVGIPHLAEGASRLEIEGHYGIRGMRERLEGLGGQLVLRPNFNNKGTLLLASIPLPSPAEAPSQTLRRRLSPPFGLFSRKS